MNLAYDLTVTSDVTTRLVEVDLGPSYRVYRLDARDGRSNDVTHVVTPNRVRVLLRREVSGPGWVVTQVIVIGRSQLELVRYEGHARSCGRGDDHRSCGPRRPAERQRTFTDLATAPGWVGHVARALLAACHEEDP